MLLHQTTPKILECKNFWSDACACMTAHRKCTFTFHVCCLKHNRNITDTWHCNSILNHHKIRKCVQRNARCHNILTRQVKTKPLSWTPKVELHSHYWSEKKVLQTFFLTRNKISSNLLFSVWKRLGDLYNNTSDTITMLDWHLTWSIKLLKVTGLTYRYLVHW